MHELEILVRGNGRRAQQYEPDIDPERRLLQVSRGSNKVASIAEAGDDRHRRGNGGIMSTKFVGHFIQRKQKPCCYSPCHHCHSLFRSIAPGISCNQAPHGVRHCAALHASGCPASYLYRVSTHWLMQPSTTFSLLQRVSSA